MLVRNAFETDFLEIANKAREWGDLVVEREGIYHIMITHFRGTCFIAEDRGNMIGYLLGFKSQSRPEDAFMHLIQVDPAWRGNGVGRRMYGMFEETAKKMGCKRIFTVARPENRYGMGFHSGMGFTIVPGHSSIDVNGIPAIKDYNGPGKHMVLWKKDL